VFTRSTGGGPDGALCAKTGETQNTKSGSEINRGFAGACPLIADLPIFGKYSAASMIRVGAIGLMKPFFYSAPTKAVDGFCAMY
jgi:hypothetical protein